LSGRFSQSIGFNQMMIYGATTSIVGVIISLGLFSSGIIHPLSLYLPMLIVAVGNGLTLPNANAGIVSVRPQLAGSASGLGGAVNIAGGAGIAAITGAMMSDGTGIWPLLGMMGLSSLLAILSANIVMRLAPRA